MARDYRVISDIAGAVGLATADLLEQHSDLGRPEQVITPHGSPYDDDCGNFVAVWINGATPTFIEEWPDAPAEPIGFDCRSLVYVPNIVVSLRRPCQPTIQNDQLNPFPTPEQMTGAGAALMVDFMVLSCELPALVHQIVSQRQEGDDYNADFPAYRVLPGVAAEYRQAEIGGWDFPFRIELGCGCEAES